MENKQEFMNNISFEELNLRHINLIINLKNNVYSSLFYKMAIIRTFDDFKIFINVLENIKNKCFIAIKKNKIIGFLFTYPLNEKKTCIKINTPKFIDSKLTETSRKLMLELIRKSIIKTDLKTSSWIINAEINNLELISCARELGFQPLQELKIWKRNINKNNNYNNTFDQNKLNNFERIEKSNIQKVLNFVRSNESIIIRNILDFNQKDIYKRNDKFCGSLIIDKEILFTIIKDNNYIDENVYSFTRAIFWDERITLILEDTLENIFKNNSESLLKTNSDDKELSLLLNNLDFFEVRSELILVRNNLIKRELKSTNKINNSIESILEKINPQGNPFPSPFPIIKR